MATEGLSFNLENTVSDNEVGGKERRKSNKGRRRCTKERKASTP